MLKNGSFNFIVFVQNVVLMTVHYNVILFLEVKVLTVFANSGARLVHGVKLVKMLRFTHLYFGDQPNHHEGSGAQASLLLSDCCSFRLLESYKHSCWPLTRSLNYVAEAQGL